MPGSACTGTSSARGAGDVTSSTWMMRCPPSASFAADALSATTTFAPASSIWYRASGPVRAGLTGVTAAPSRQAANMLVISSTRLGSMMASTSPRRSPASASRAAAADTVLGETCVVEFLALVGDAGLRGIPRGPFVGYGGCEHGGTFRAVRVCAVPTLRSASPPGIGRASPNRRRRWCAAYILATGRAGDWTRGPSRARSFVPAPRCGGPAPALSLPSRRAKRCA